MVSRAWAVAVVERYLAGLNAQPYAPVLVVVGTEAHPLGWLVVPQSEAYARTRDVRDALVGAGYLLVDGIDGSLHQVHATADLAHGEWIDEYRERVGGVPRPDPLRERVTGCLAGGSRLAALRAVRAAAPGLSPSHAREYVDAVAAGAEVPGHVLGRLPAPPETFAVWQRLSGPNPEE